MIRKSFILLLTATIIISCFPQAVFAENPDLDKVTIDEINADFEVIRRDLHDTLLIVQGMEIAFTSNEEFTNGKLRLTNLESGESYSLTIETTRLNNEKYLNKMIDSNGKIEIISDNNILKPLAENQDLVSINSVPSTFFWDAVRYRGDSAYGIKYSRPDVDYYEIEPWDFIKVTGRKLYHYQLKDSWSQALWGTSTVVACAAIGALIGGGWGAAVGALMGALMPVFSEAIFADDRGCIWVWEGKTKSWQWYLTFYGYYPDYMRVGPYTLKNNYDSTYAYPMPNSYPEGPIIEPM